MEWVDITEEKQQVDFGTAAAKSYILNNYEITFNNKEDIQKLVNGAIEYANMIVYEKSKEDERYKYMGATLEILLIINDDIYIGHAGDSRIYRLRRDVLKKLTKDHSYIENLIEDGKITREEAVKHPDKNMVTKGILRVIAQMGGPAPKWRFWWNWSS